MIILTNRRLLRSLFLVETISICPPVAHGSSFWKALKVLGSLVNIFSTWAEGGPLVVAQPTISLRSKLIIGFATVGGPAVAGITLGPLFLEITIFWALIFNFCTAGRFLGPENNAQKRSEQNSWAICFSFFFLFSEIGQNKLLLLIFPTAGVIEGP